MSSIKKSTLIGSLAVITAAILWSIDGLFRRSLFSLPPSVIVFWEHVLGLAILTPLIIRTLPAFKKLSLKQWRAIISVAFLSGALGTILFTAALAQIQFIPFSVVVLLQLLQPIFAITAARIILKEPLSKFFIILAGLGLGGAYLLSFPQLTPNLQTGQGTFIAALMAAGAAAAWGTSTAFSKYSLKNTSVLHVSAMRFLFTIIFALGFIMILNTPTDIVRVSSNQWPYLLVITFSSGLVALVIYYFGLQKILASRSTILELTWPLSASLMGALFLGENLTLIQWIGAILLFVSVTIIAQGKDRKLKNARSRNGAVANF
jgi:DME family drug/metabolite transporter